MTTSYEYDVHLDVLAARDSREEFLGEYVPTAEDWAELEAWLVVCERDEDILIPDDGYADGGEPYTDEELELGKAA